MYDTFGNYFKKSFKAISNNPVLLIPTLFELILTLIPMLIFFMGFRSYGFNMPMNFNPAYIVGIVVSVIVILILLLFITSGKFNMIKQKIITDEVSMEDFWYGATKYAGRILLGNLILFGGVLLLGIIVIPIAMTMGIGMGRNAFILIILGIPLLIAMMVFFLFISFWQIILVYEDCEVFKSFKLSMTFVKQQFWLVLIVSILRGIFTGNNNANRNNNHSMNFGNNSPMNMLFSPGHLGVLGVFGFIISIIKAILKLFFDILFFTIYDDRRRGLSKENDYTLDSFDDLEYE